MSEDAQGFNAPETSGVRFRLRVWETGAGRSLMDEGQHEELKQIVVVDVCLRQSKQLSALEKT